MSKLTEIPKGPYCYEPDVEKYPLDLLWDQVKECGENSDWE